MYSRKLQFYVGSTLDGEDVYGDFCESGSFIAAGRHDSSLMNYVCGTFLESLVQNNDPESLQFVMYDPSMKLPLQYDRPEYLWCGIVRDEGETRATIADLVVEVERRFELFRIASVRNVAEYNAKVEGEKLPYIIFVGIEIADLLFDDSFYEMSFAELSHLTGATGVHLLLATNRPEVHIVTDLLCGSISGRLLFPLAHREHMEQLYFKPHIIASLSGPDEALFADYLKGAQAIVSKRVRVSL